MAIPLSAFLVLVTLGSFQGPVRGFRWWLDPHVQQELRLTARQVADIGTEFDRTLKQRRLLRREFDAANAELMRAFARGDLSDASAEQLVTRVEDLRRQRNVARMRLLVSIYFVLTPEQRTRFPGLVRLRPVR
jgi:Spy/CpxP family protein refolding chaperone